LPLRGIRFVDLEDLIRDAPLGSLSVRGPPTRLRPRVRNLYVEVPVAVGRERAERWVASLREALDAAPLPVPAATR